MQNRYPLEPPLGWDGLVGNTLVFCKESNREFAEKQLDLELNEAVLLRISDAMEPTFAKGCAEQNEYFLQAGKRIWNATRLTKSRSRLMRRGVY